MPVSRPSPRAPAPPLGPESLDRLALRYVERFATTRGKLADYLRRKLRTRGWAEDAPPPAIEVLVERLAELGYIDDRAFGEARAAAMTRRGLGARRVAEALRHAGIEGEDAAAIVPGIADQAVAAALAFARRKRIGPYAAVAAGRELRHKHAGALIRAGHAPQLAWRIAAMDPASHCGEELDLDDCLARSLS